MCVSAGAPKKPSFGACHESHGNSQYTVNGNSYAYTAYSSTSTNSTGTSVFSANGGYSTGGWVTSSSQWVTVSQMKEVKWIADPNDSERVIFFDGKYFHVPRVDKESGNYYITKMTEKQFKERNAKGGK